MKFAHASDLHFAPKTLEEVRPCFSVFVETAIAEECDVAVISGDLFDHRVDLHAPAVSCLFQLVARLADHMPVLILQGTYSHDVPGSLDVFRTIGVRFPVYVADKIQQVALTFSNDKTQCFWRPSEGRNLGKVQFEGFVHPTDVLFSCLPPVNKSVVAATAGTDNVAFAAGEHVAAVLEGWAENNLRARAAGIPTVVVTHGTVHGCVTEHGVPMAGLDHEYTTGALFASQASAILVGHIHKHQSWKNPIDAGCYQTIAYPGSIGRLHFGELDPKGFLIWEITAERSLFEFRETPAKRLLEKTFEGIPTEFELAALARDAAGAHVRIRYTVDEENRSAVDKEAIVAMFKHAGALKLEGTIKPIQRTRSEGMNRASSLREKLDKWCGVTSVAAGPLVERLDLLQQKDPADIVRNLSREQSS
jgi:exonuclease SbcD